jgi:hypothetical protein
MGKPGPRYAGRDLAGDNHGVTKAFTARVANLPAIELPKSLVAEQFRVDNVSELRIRFAIEFKGRFPLRRHIDKHVLLRTGSVVRNVRRRHENVVLLLSRY